MLHVQIPRFRWFVVSFFTSWAVLSIATDGKAFEHDLLPAIPFLTGGLLPIVVATLRRPYWTAWGSHEVYLVSVREHGRPAETHYTRLEFKLSRLPPDEWSAVFNKIWPRSRKPSVRRHGKIIVVEFRQSEHSYREIIRMIRAAVDQANATIDRHIDERAAAGIRAARAEAEARRSSAVALREAARHEGLDLE